LAGACALNAGLYVLGTWLRRRYILGPIQSLNHAVRCLQSGQLQEVETSSTDELSSLGLAFNEMSHGIQNLLAENNRTAETLKTSETRYRLLFDSNPSPILIFDKQTLRVLEVNQAAVHHYGYSREEFLAKTV